MRVFQCVGFLHLLKSIDMYINLAFSRVPFLHPTKTASMKFYFLYRMATLWVPSPTGLAILYTSGYMVFACGSLLFHSVACKGFAKFRYRYTLAFAPPSPAVRFATAVSCSLITHSASALTPFALSCRFIWRVPFLHFAPYRIPYSSFRLSTPVFFISAGAHSHWGRRRLGGLRLHFI